ncbi:MAG: hypothetical protein ABI770_08685 [Sphingomicrobium sp.]
MEKKKADELAQAICAAHSWGKAEYIDAGASAAVYRIDHPELGPAALKVYDPEFFASDNAEAERNRLRQSS